MTIEASQTINTLNTSFPRSSDLLKEGDDHIRLIKANLIRTFPRITGAVNFSSDKLNVLDSISDVSGGSMKITVPTSSPDVSAGTRASGNSGVIRLLTNTDREVNFSIPQNRADTVVTNKTSNITTWDFGNLDFYNVHNINANNAVSSKTLAIDGRIDGKDAHLTSVNSSGSIVTSDRLVGVKGVTVGQGGGGSPGADLAFYAGDQTLNQELQVKTYPDSNYGPGGGSAVWALNTNYTAAIAAYDFNSLGVLCGDLYSKGQLHWAGGSRADSSGNIIGSAWNHSGGNDIKGYITKNYVNDVQYQGETSVHGPGQAGDSTHVPPGAFMTGIHQGSFNGEIYIEDLFYRYLVKRLGDGSAYIIPAQP